VDIPAAVFKARALPQAQSRIARMGGTDQTNALDCGIVSSGADTMKPCRACSHQVSEDAVACPSCGAPFPAREKWDGWGWEYKSGLHMWGLPLLHISFKYRPNRMPVVAKGVIAIGQFACGIVTISQFGVGVISVSQFTVAVFALAQFALAYSLIAQLGVYLHEGHGQLVRSLAELLAMLAARR
jgi:hypothetical protein